MAKTMVLLKPVHTHVEGKRVSPKKAASNVNFNLAAMVALAEGTGVPIDVLLNEALYDFINVTGRYLATDHMSRKEWEDRISPEVKERCAAALHALNPQSEEHFDQASIDRAIRDLDPDNQD